MDPKLAATKKTITSLLLVLGVAVIGVGAFVLSKTGMQFLFGERAATSGETSLTGVIKSTSTSSCYKLMPSQYRTVPYVLEGSFPVIYGPATLPTGKTSFFVSEVDAAMVSPRERRAGSTPAPRAPVPTPTPINYSFTSNCRPVYATGVQIGRLLNQYVTVTGVLKGIVLYASTIKPGATPTPTPLKSNTFCPGAEACPYPAQPSLLRNCHPADTDNTPNESLCNTAGRAEFCGSKYYCCPEAGGSWTSDLTKCPSVRPTSSPTGSTKCAIIGGNCVAASNCDLYGGPVSTGYLCGNTPYSCCKSAVIVRPAPTTSAAPAPTSSFQTTP